MQMAVMSSMRKKAEGHTPVVRIEFPSAFCGNKLSWVNPDDEPAPRRV